MRTTICLLTFFFLGAFGHAPGCWAADPPIETGEKQDTMLYVRTIPPGAKVFLDGKELGKSNGLFPVEPGVGKIVVELKRQKTEKQVTIRANKITRIELALKPKAGTPSQVIKEAVIAISQCAEGDPRVEEAMRSLRPLKQAEVVKGLIPYLDYTYQETARRAAIYILWKGKFANIAPAVPTLEKLLGHEDVFTRGMAALALGQNKVSSSYDAMAKMTASDSSPYARRCAAIALGWLGDKRAEPVLEAAMKDSDPLVRTNARVGLDILHGKEPDPLRILRGKETPAKDNLLKNPGMENGDEAPDAWDQDAKKKAVEAAEAWLALVDAGKYAESWDEAAEQLKNAVSKDAFAHSLGAVRKPLGDVTSRKIESKRYLTKLPGAPDGEYVVIQYKTAFANKESATETITPMLGKDKKWRVSGYYIK